MDELYMYYTVLYRKFSGLRRRYNTNYIVMTNYTRGLLNQTVSYRSISYSDPALPLCQWEPTGIRSRGSDNMNRVTGMHIKFENKKKDNVRG